MKHFTFMETAGLFLALICGVLVMVYVIGLFLQLPAKPPQQFTTWADYHYTPPETAR